LSDLSPLQLALTAATNLRQSELLLRLRQSLLSETISQRGCFPMVIQEIKSLMDYCPQHLSVFFRG